MILSNSLTPSEKKWVWTASQTYGDEILLQNSSMPVGVSAIPRQDTSCNYQIPTSEETNPDILSRDHMIAWHVFRKLPKR